MCHYQIAHCQLGAAVSAVMKLGTSETFLAKKPASSQRTMSSSALFFSSATPDSGLPVVVFAPATPQIDSDAPPELVSRVSRVLAEPIAAPARARSVEDEAPMDGPETETDAPKVNWVFYVPEVLHSLESNSAPMVANSAPVVANSAPDLSDQIAISTRAINARAKAAFALDDSEHMIHHDTS